MPSRGTSLPCLGGIVFGLGQPQPRKHCTLEAHHPGHCKLAPNPVSLAWVSLEPDGSIMCRCTMCSAELEPFSWLVRRHYVEDHDDVDMEAIA